MNTDLVLTSRPTPRAWAHQVILLVILCSLLGCPHVCAAEGIALTKDGRSALGVNPACSADGRAIVFVKRINERMQLWTMDTDGGHARAISAIGDIADYWWAPDGRQLLYLYAEPDGTTCALVLYDVESGTNETIDTAQAIIYQNASVAWAHNARQFLVKRRRIAEQDFSGLYLYDTTTRQGRDICPNNLSSYSMRDVSWSPDDTRVIFSSRTSKETQYGVWSYALDTNTARPLTPADWSTSCVSWSPDGAWLAFNCSADLLKEEQEAGQSDVWIMRPDGTEVHAVTHGSSPAPTKRVCHYAYGWTADSRYLLTGADRVNAEGNTETSINLVDAQTGESVTLVNPRPDERQRVDARAFVTAPRGGDVAMLIARYSLAREGQGWRVVDEQISLAVYLADRRETRVVTTCMPDRDHTRIFNPHWAPDASAILATRARTISKQENQFDMDIVRYPLMEEAGTPAADESTPMPPAKEIITAKLPVLVTLRNRNVDDLAKALPAAYKGLYTTDARLNAFMVTAPDADTLAAFRANVELLDQAPMVMVDVLVTELTRDASRQLGLNWEFAKKRVGATLPTTADGGVGQVIYQGVGVLNDKFFATLSALEEQGKAKVRANPRVVTISGSQATIDIRRTDNFFYVSGSYDGQTIKTRSDISAEIMLKIQPLVYAGGRIRLAVDATVDSFVFTAQGELPDTTRRQAATELVLDDGQSVIIGGLTLIEEARKVQKTPILGDLPVLGGLFRHTNVSSKETTIVIFVNPHIITAETPPIAPFITPPTPIGAE